jgi:hypothetical protein
MIYRLFNVDYTLKSRFFILAHTGNLIQYVQRVTETLCNIYNWLFRFFEHKIYFCVCTFKKKHICVFF